MMEVHENPSEYMVRNKRPFRNSSRRFNETNTEEAAAQSGETQVIYYSFLSHLIVLQRFVSSTGGKVIRLVFVGFGLLCIVQASLNVYLRLSLCVDNKCENVTAERDELLKMNLFLQTSHKNLSEERDELQKNYSLLKISHQEISEERDQLKQKQQNLNTCVDSNLKEQWVNFSSSLYLAPAKTLSWEESKQFCRERGADLIIINSREEQEFAITFREHRWIGLTDLESEGVWKWVDDSGLNLSFWSPKEPNNMYIDEDCVEMISDKGLNNWNDLKCKYQRFFICEKDVFEKI